MAKQKEESTALATVDEMVAAAQGMVKSGTSAALLSAFQGMVIEEVVSLEEGRMLNGLYLGPGGPLDVTDPSTGEVRPLNTWRVQHPTNKQVVALLLGCAKLNRFFGGCPVGSKVTIVRRGTVKSRAGRVVNDYVTGHIPPARDGEVIEATAD